MSTAAAAMMMKMKEKMEEKKKAIPGGNSFEIDLIEEAGILVTVKAKPNPKLAAAAAGGGERSGVEVGSKEESRSRIVRLSNAVIEEDDLGSEEDYEDIMDDLTEEGVRVGELVKVVIPRPDPDPVPGVGKAFFEYADLDGASRAISAFNGKRWGSNIVSLDYFPEDLYTLGHFDAAP